MQLTLIKNNVVIPFVLPKKVSGQYWVTHFNNEGIEERLLRVEAINEEWNVCSYKRATLIKQGQKIKDTRLDSEVFHHLIIKEGNQRALLYVEPLTADRCQYEKIILPKKGSVAIGRNEDNDISFSNTYVSGKHAEIFIENKQIIIKDLNSSNGTYVNGMRINEKRLAVGDTIYILGLKIIIGDGFLAFNNPDHKVVYNRSLLKKYQRPSIEAVKENEFNEFEDNINYFYRSPRFKEEIEEIEITIDGPPSKENYQPLPLALVIGPSLTMGMSSLFTAIFTIQNILRNNGDLMNAMPTIIMSCSMLLGTVMWPLLTKRYEKKKSIEKENLRQEKYIQYLKEMDTEIKQLCSKQTRILHKNHISIKECAERIKNKDRVLWEREIGQDDFLKLRIGKGDIPLKATLKYPTKRFTLNDDLLQNKMLELAESPKILSNVPITISLQQQKVIGVIGNTKERFNFIKGLLVQMIALHSYDELKIVFIYNPKDNDEWKFVKWLPHIMDEESEARFIATNPIEVKVLNSVLEPIFIQRKESSEDKQDSLSTHYVIISLDKYLANKSELIRKIVKEKRNLGFSLLSVAESINDLPKECHQIIDFSENRSRLYDKKNITLQRQTFINDISFTDDIEELAIKLANIKLDKTDATFNLPSMLTFLELFGVGKVEHLNSLARWHDNDPTISLDTPIGIDTTGEKFHLDLHEKYHGPHGLVAGMTGSGKSEFIISYILSLAVNYHPNEVSFILIDYKGGGMANAFANLPHLVGTITNLDGAAVNRSLLSIESELKRRQAIFGQTSKYLNISNIDIYKYQKLFREGKVDEPLPHLFIISDEFAELKSQQPEFMAKLISAARIGRSLGIHLILATQKPSGVVDDQIWSNSKFRVCLKVQEKQDSQEMLKRPDAAELTNTGRFYLQVGHNELFELGQSCWSGALYYPTDKMEKQYDNSIIIIDTMGRRIKELKPDHKKNVLQNTIKQVDAVLNYLVDLSMTEDIKIKPLWLEPIAPMIYLDQLMTKYRYTSRDKNVIAVVGEYDDPTNQAQHLLTIPVIGEGNIVIYGMEGSGKTTFLTTLMCSLIKNYEPAYIHMYVLDFSLGTLKPFEKAPHVGDVILSDEAEKINNLFKLLQDEIEYRKQVLLNFGGDYLSYIQESANIMPVKLIIIHNYAVFKETCEDNDEVMSYLTREGNKYGIYFIITGIDAQSLSYRIRSNFKQTYVLQMNDRLDYGALLGGSMNGLVPAAHKGRGLFKKEVPYEFQIAHIGSEIMKPFDYLKMVCEQESKKSYLNNAPKIPILPKVLWVDELKDYYASNQKINETIVGLEKDTLKINTYDFSKEYINIISSEEANYEIFLQALAELISQQEELLVFDPNSLFINDLEKKYKLIDRTQTNQSFNELLSHMLERHEAIKAAKLRGELIEQYSRIYIMINSIHTLFDTMSNESADKLRNVLENGKIEFNVNFIIYDQAHELEKMRLSDWYRKRVNTANGIWLGDGINNQKILKYDIFSAPKVTEIGNTFGYSMNKGKLKLIKLINSKKYEFEDERYG